MCSFSQKKTQHVISLNMLAKQSFLDICYTPVGCIASFGSLVILCYSGCVYRAWSSTSAQLELQDRDFYMVFTNTTVHLYELHLIHVVVSGL